MPYRRFESNPFSAYEYEPHPWQLRMHKSRAKTKWVQAGRRAGKTRGSLQEDLDTIDEISRKYVKNERTGRHLTAEKAGLIPAIHCWTVAPTKAQMYQVWNEMQAFIPNHLVSRTNPYVEDNRRGGGRGSGFKEDDLHVWLVMKDEDGNWLTTHRKRDGGLIDRPRPIIFWELKTANNPETLQSVGLDFLHVTEAQDISEAAWLKLRPTLMSPGRMGRALIEGIPPQSPSHWFARGFRQASDADPNDRLRASFHATYLDNPLLSADQIREIEEDKQTMLIEDWERLYMAKQPEGKGAFFQKVNEAKGRNGLRGLLGPESGRAYVGGLDLGRANDPTIFVIKDRVTRESVYADEMMHTDWNLQVATIKSTTAHWNLEQVYMDSTGLGGLMGKDVLYSELLQQNVPVIGYNFSQQRKYQMYLDYAVSLQHGSVSFPEEWEALSTQLQDMAHKETANRGHHFYAMSGGHDDWVDAECLSLMACDPPLEGGDAGSLSMGMTIQQMQPIGNTVDTEDEFLMAINRQRSERKRKLYDEQIKKQETLAAELSGISE